LQQVVTAIGRTAGIETKLPASTSTVPVFANLGPGDPRQVVSALLDGTPFNWSLATEGDAPRRLVAVVLTEQSAPLEPAKLAGAAAQAANTSQNAKSQTMAQDKEKRDAATSEAALQDQPSDQRKPRPELDEATLSKLPPLPPGVPSSMWQLFPDLVANAQSGSPLLPSGQLPSTASNLTRSASDPVSVPRGCRNCPVPPGVDPRVVNLYPWNLMQLIQTQPTLPNVTLPPPPPWAGRVHP
jgi:hypothetical protein